MLISHLVHDVTVHITESDELGPLVVLESIALQATNAAYADLEDLKPAVLIGLRTS
jgi:hypothetical protein